MPGKEHGIGYGTQFMIALSRNNQHPTGGISACGVFHFSFPVCFSTWFANTFAPAYLVSPRQTQPAAHRAGHPINYVSNKSRGRLLAVLYSIYSHCRPAHFYPLAVLIHPPVSAAGARLNSPRFPIWKALHSPNKNQ